MLATVVAPGPESASAKREERLEVLAVPLGVRLPKLNASILTVERRLVDRRPKNSNLNRAIGNAISRSPNVSSLC
jgi:hypothetical protein